MCQDPQMHHVVKQKYKTSRPGTWFIVKTLVEICQSAEARRSLKSVFQPN